MSFLSSPVRTATRIAKLAVADFNRQRARSATSLSLHEKDRTTVLEMVTLDFGFIEAAPNDSRAFRACVWAKADIALVTEVGVTDNCEELASKVADRAFSAGRRILDEVDDAYLDLPELPSDLMSDEDIASHLSEFLDTFFSRSRAGMEVTFKVAFRDGFAEREQFVYAAELAPRAQELLDERWATADSLAQADR